MSNLNTLLLQLPNNAIITSDYLKKLNITSRMMSYYTKVLKFFKAMGRGVFLKKGDELRWQGVLWALQQEEPIHLGGLTALNTLGYAHFIRRDDKMKIFFYSSEHLKLPKWVKTLFKNRIRLVNDNFLPSDLGITEHTFRGLTFSIKVSAPERAILELLYLCPTKASLKEAYQIMELLMGLRPKLMQELLEKCESVKVKRLFLFMAEKLEHSWLEFMDLSKIDLGSGIRSFAKNGEFNKKYKIMIDKDIENI